MKQKLEPLKLKVLNNEIELDKVCNSCTDIDFNNFEKDVYIVRNNTCERCNGKHFILSKTGQTLIELLKRYL